MTLSWQTQYVSSSDPLVAVGTGWGGTEHQVQAVLPLRSLRINTLGDYTAIELGIRPGAWLCFSGAAGACCMGFMAAVEKRWRRSCLQACPYKQKCAFFKQNEFMLYATCLQQVGSGLRSRNARTPRGVNKPLVFSLSFSVLILNQICLSHYIQSSEYKYNKQLFLTNAKEWTEKYASQQKRVRNVLSFSYVAWFL